MTFSDILADLYRRTNYSTSPALEVQARFQAFVNEALQEILSEPDLASVLSRAEPVTVASVASQSVYTFPAPFARIASVTERTNDRRLRNVSQDWWRMADPDPTANTGTPEAWVSLGFVGVAKQPSDASQIFVDSTDAADVSTAYLEGIRTGGYPISLSVTMTGTTAVSFSSSFTDIVQITKFYLLNPAVGTVTLHEDASGGTELARIPIGQTFSRYLGFALWPTPAAAITYYLDGDRDLPRMVQPSDEPPIPLRFHQMLVDGALAREWEKKDRPDLAQGAQMRFRRAMGKLKYVLCCPPDFLPSRMGAGARSRLGAQYPGTDW